MPAASDLPAMEILPGPTGESNQLSIHPRGRVLCLGPSRAAALRQALAALAQRNSIVIIADDGELSARELQQAGFKAMGMDGLLEPEALEILDGFDAVMSDAHDHELTAYRIALSRRQGRIIPLIIATDEPDRLVLERHLCIDTTAAGGNASLIAEGDQGMPDE